MSLAIGHLTATSPHSTRGRQANFGSLVSAIKRGDLDAAQNAFAGLSELAPKAPGPLRKGALDALEKALKESDLEAAQKALKEIQQNFLTKAGSSAAEETSGTGPAPGSRINILV